MAVLTLSRQIGSGGDDIAQAVAGALGLKVVDKDRLRRAAEKAGVPSLAFHELTYEGRRSLVEEMLLIFQSMPAIPVAPRVSRSEVIGPFRLPFGGAFASSIPPVSSVVEALEGYLRIVAMAMRDLAEEGNVLILGQGGQAILRDQSHVLHLLVVAAQADRVAAVARQMQLTEREARRKVHLSDKARAQFLARHYQIDWLDPQHYHLVLNTSLLSREAAVQIILAAVETLEGAPPSPAPHPTADEQGQEGN